MDFDFTLLCFIKCFNLKYSRSATSDNHLKMFFNNTIGFDDYVNGKTDPICNLKISIKASNFKSNLVDYFSEETVRNVYTHIIGEPNNMEIPDMLYDLLSYACGISQETQRKIFEKRRSEEFLNYIAELKSSRIQATENKIESMDTIDLIEKAISNDLGLGELEKIDMAFHCGAEWRTTVKRHNLLMKIKEKGISLRVLINSSAEIGSFASHIKNSQIRQLEIDECVQAWEEFANEYPDFVKVQVAKVPLFRNIYFLHGKEKGIAKTRGYCMGKCVDSIPPKLYYSSSDDFKIYLEEYEYIWRISK